MTNKYKNKKTIRKVGKEIYKFDSQAEARHFDLLYAKAKAGEISQLKLQPRYEIAKAYKILTTKTKSGKSKIGSLYYTPDFEYIDKYGELVAVEVKGKVDTAFRLRQKLFMGIGYKEHGIFKYVIVFKDETVEYDLMSVCHDSH